MRAERRPTIVAAVVLGALLWPATGAAAPTVTELTGGVTPGFTAANGPIGITSGPDGNIWFTQNGGPGRVARVNPNLTVTELLGGVTPGFSAGGEPRGIATGPDGNIWFAQQGNPGRVGRVNPGLSVTEFVGGVTPGFSAGAGPSEITTGPDGNIWFTGFDNPGRVGRVNSNGTVTELIGGVTPGFSVNRNPNGITSGPDGNIWFIEAEDVGALGRVNSNGTVTRLIGGVTPGFTGDSGEDITTGADGNIWFTQPGGPGRVARVNPDLTVTELVGGVTPGFSTGGEPHGITTGPDGNIWFTERADPGRVGRVNCDGSVTEFTGGITPGFSPNAWPTGITSGPDGNVWFTQYASPGRVARITMSPYAVTGPASAVGHTSATLAGTVCPNKQGTSYRFEYGTTTAYGSQTAATNAISGTAPAAVSAAIAGLSPNTLYHYRLTATSASDTSFGEDRTFTTAAVPSDGGGASLAELTRLRISPAAFAAADRGPSARPAQRRRWGATVSFRLDRSATVRFTVQRARKGRRVGGRCVKPTRSNHRRAGCTRYLGLRGSFGRTGNAGTNRFRFTGRLRGRRLRPAAYRLVATPRTNAPSSQAKRARFRIRRSR